ncbi:hypothetical protein C8R44DRAFT_868851 [Mycena epipterygia]|nr:hypothetical protein C8R44DRAFT_868851 [Mycena epipterygia]
MSILLLKLLFSGHFVTHPECCARIDGTHQTFSVHVSDPADKSFVPLAVPPTTPPKKDPKKDPPPLPPYYCRSCTRPDQLPDSSETPKLFVFRVGFGLEGHCFWMPTAWYNIIVSAPTVPRGCKSRAFAIPNEFIDGPVNTKPGSDLKISIQAAFIRPNWTLVFVDHNVMISFHLMQMSDSFSREDLNPASFIWSSLWSRSHGPVYNLEPAATLRALDDWRTQILTGSPGDNTPILH